MCIGPASSPSVSGWTGGREVVDPTSVSERARLLRQHLREPLVAHLSLARAHRDRAVPLEYLHVSEALVHALYHVLGQHVLTVADELARSRRKVPPGPV